jgi:hypothetical protein
LLVRGVVVQDLRHRRMTTILDAAVHNLRYVLRLDVGAQRWNLPVPSVYCVTDWRRSRS